MKNIDIVIPTRNRYEKLARTIGSIPLWDYIKTNVICDNDVETYKKLLTGDGLPAHKTISTRLEIEHKGAVYCRNKFISNHCKDGVLYATDDITFEPGSIENAFKAFNSHFPDDDGVVGFIIDLPDWHPTGVALVGKHFIDRYPKRQLFFPGYFHFSCQEIYWLASKLGKFYQEKNAIVKHYHPGFYKKAMDKTHGEARIYSERDHALIKSRQAKGLIWGDSE